MKDTDLLTELKRKYDLQETLIKAKNGEVQKWKKKAQDTETRIKAIDKHFQNLNWIQKCIARLFRIGF